MPVLCLKGQEFGIGEVPHPGGHTSKQADAHVNQDVRGEFGMKKTQFPVSPEN